MAASTVPPAVRPAASDAARWPGDRYRPNERHDRVRPGAGRLHLCRSDWRVAVAVWRLCSQPRRVLTGSSILMSDNRRRLTILEGDRRPDRCDPVGSAVVSREREERGDEDEASVFGTQRGRVVAAADRMWSERRGPGRTHPERAPAA